VRHLLSIDLEDWYLDVETGSGATVADAARALDRQLAALTAILDDAGVRATMFVLGRTAERYPDHVARLAAAGHEIASHGHDHRRLTELSRDELERDVARGAAVLEQITGRRPIGYRAPYFSLPRDRARELYAILAAYGFRYSSSLRGEAGPAGGPIRELPSTAWTFARRVIPWGGGGSWRALPSAAVIALVAAHQARGRAVAAYLHPHELDPLPLVSRRGALRDAWVNTGRRGTGELLRRLLRRFAFAPYASALEATP
jgi:peptidoglycan/xylan/chitin deacetylase (PgdA/CDA1 family)